MFSVAIITQLTSIQLYMYTEVVFVIESVDSISRDERGFPLTQYITNGGISRAGYTITHFKHHIVFYGCFPIE